MSRSTKKLCSGTLLCCVLGKIPVANKIVDEKGEYQKFQSKKFCLTVPKHFVEKPFCSVFQKNLLAKKFWEKRAGEVSRFSVDKFSSHSAEKNLRGNF